MRNLRQEQGTGKSLTRYLYHLMIHVTCLNRRSSNEGQPLVARALYDFSAGNSDELSVSTGDELVSTAHHMTYTMYMINTQTLEKDDTRHTNQIPRQRLFRKIAASGGT